MLIQSSDHEEITFEEQTASDPKVVDDLLTQEMTNLSVTDRNDLLEEIHGVKCMAVEETPELLQAALKQLAFEIDENTPDSQKRAYLQSLKQPRPNPANPNNVNVKLDMNMNMNNDELQVHQRILQHELRSPQSMSRCNTNTNNNNNANSNYCYIHDDVEFRLRFLRCEFFHVQKSAKRMLRFLDLVLELFGDFALRRPIRLSDFTKEEMRYLRNGRFQIMPNRDRSGRRITTIFPENVNAQQSVLSECPPMIKAKITLYSSWAVGHRDVETQRKGHIILVWYDKALAIRFSKEKLRYRWDACKSTRVAAIHLCSPDTPHFRLRRSIAVMRCGDENRPRLRTHLGGSVELQYALQGYGIPTEDIPISSTGNIKMKNLVQWMRIRHAVENHDDCYLSSSSTSNTGTMSTSRLMTTSMITSMLIPMPPSGIVECPQPNDVLFRKGNSYVSQTGNAKLRAMIVSKACHDEHDNNNSNNDSAGVVIMKRPKQLASEIFRERLEKSRNSTKDADNIGRYLIWNTQKDCWNEMTDWEQICLKIEYMTRQLHKSRGSGSNKLKNNNNETTKKSQKRSVPVKLQSGTTLFRSQDGRSDELFGGKFKKSRKKNICVGVDVDDGVDNDSGKSDEDRNAEAAECFGMAFLPCSM